MIVYYIVLHHIILYYIICPPPQVVDAYYIVCHPPGVSAGRGGSAPRKTESIITFVHNINNDYNNSD